MPYCVQASSEAEARVRERSWLLTSLGRKQSRKRGYIRHKRRAFRFLIIIHQFSPSFPKRHISQKGSVNQEFKRCPTAFLKSHYLPKANISPQLHVHTESHHHKTSVALTGSSFVNSAVANQAKKGVVW